MAPTSTFELVPGERGPRVDIFRNRVRDARERRGLTQLELAVRAGITPSTLSRIENGHQMPNLVTVFQLARTLGVSVEEMIG